MVSLTANLTHSRISDRNSVRAITQLVEDLHTVGARILDDV